MRMMQVLLQAQEPELRFFEQVFFFQVRLLHCIRKIRRPVVDQPFDKLRVGPLLLQLLRQLYRFRGNTGAGRRKIKFGHYDL